MADMIGAADEAEGAAIGIVTAAAGVANPIAEPVARRAVSDASAVGTDIGSTTLARATAGAADRHAAPWGNNAGSILAGLVSSAAGDGPATSAQATFVAAAGPQRFASRPRLIGRGLRFCPRFVRGSRGVRPGLVGGLRLCPGRFPVRPRLIRRRTGSLALVPGVSCGEALTAGGAVLGTGPTMSDQGDKPCAGQTGEPA
jgi:hypothetical protein